MNKDAKEEPIVHEAAHQEGKIKSVNEEEDPFLNEERLDQEEESSPMGPISTGIDPKQRSPELDKKRKEAAQINAQAETKGDSCKCNIF